MANHRRLNGGTEEKRTYPASLLGPMPLRWLGGICLVFATSILCPAAGQVQPATVEELRAAIQEELDKVGRGSVGVALVTRDETIWAAGIGLADPDTSRQADENTYWRLGSITKSFVGLAALVLEERGQLRLTDEVAKLAPNIEIRNRWNDEAPVRLEHLLEHTAGLDDLHYKDYLSNDPSPLSLAQGLAQIRRSLYCRWPPGIHFSYSNAGSSVAAYVVQTIDGRLFEQFLADEILAPLNMQGASLILTDHLNEGLATGYGGDGSPVPYRHLVARPAGALSATPRQMANFVRMLLGRGEFEGRKLVSRESIERMERSETTVSSALLPEYGYGLGNYATSAGGFVFRGHDGGMPGYRAWYAYSPDIGLGFCAMLSASNNQAANRINVLVAEYLVRGVRKPDASIIPEMPADINRWTGYYRPVTPRDEGRRYVERLAGVVCITRRDDMLVAELPRQRLEFHPSTSRTFRRKLQPMATLALVEGPDGKKYIQGETGNLQKVSAAAVWFERILGVASGLLMISSPLWAAVWMPLKLGGRLKSRSVLVRVWPLLSVMALVVAVTAVGVNTEWGSFVRLVDQLGRPTPVAVSFVILSWIFVLLALHGLVFSVRSDPLCVGRLARMHSIAVCTSCSVVAAYLLYFRAIGFPSWR